MVRWRLAWVCPSTSRNSPARSNTDVLLCIRVLGVKQSAVRLRARDHTQFGVIIISGSDLIIMASESYEIFLVYWISCTISLCSVIWAGILRKELRLTSPISFQRQRDEMGVVCSAVRAESISPRTKIENTPCAVRWRQ
jgi:hypothetical protein